MDWALVLVLQVMFQPCLSDLFTVDAERNMYESEFGGDVVMGCKFQPIQSNPLDNLKVTWHRITSSSAQELYWLDNGQEHSASQDPHYQGRVRLLTAELKKGLARLQVSRLRINDSGTYQCLVQTTEGADYKKITLSVKAPYKTVNKTIQKTAEGDKLLLTCQSEGYPSSPVIWQDGQLRTIKGNTTAVSTPDQLFKVTSEIHIPSSDRNNYTCTFTNDGSSATFHVPDEIPALEVKHNGLIVVLSIGVIMTVIVVAVFMHRQRKGSKAPSTTNPLINSQVNSVSAADCLQVNRDNEEEITIFTEGYTEENVGAFVKAHYSEVYLTSDVRRHMGAFDVETLHQRLQNSDGKPVNLQAVVPEGGETLFLEGPPGSGKTTVARILVSAWTDGATDSFSKVLDLGAIQLLLCVNCSKSKGDLFQELSTQLCLAEKIPSEDELRALLTRSSKVLLLLDDYREGNQVFDESLKRFLSKRGGCRVLIMACPGHFSTLRDTVGTTGMLKLQAQTVKY